MTILTVVLMGWFSTTGFTQEYFKYETCYRAGQRLEAEMFKRGHYEVAWTCSEK